MKWFQYPFLMVVAGAFAAAPPAAAANSDAPTVTVVHPRKTTLTRSTTQPATLHAWYEARLDARVEGYVKTVHVDIGDAVKAGQTLAEIDVPELVQARERQQAEITRLERLKDQQQAAVQAAHAQLEADQSEAERVAELVKTKAVTPRAGDEAQARLAAARAAVAVAEAEVAAAAAASEVARKMLAEMEAQIGFATLKAPFDGIVTERHVELGDLIRQGQKPAGQPLFAVAQVKQLRLRTAIPERDAVWVKPGNPVRLKLFARPGEVVTGKVARAAGILDERTRTMLVEADLPNPDGQLLAGMFGEATIVMESRPDCLVLPAETVHFDDDGGASVIVVNDQGKVKNQPVVTGMDDGRRIEIRSGLQGNERVVTSQRGALLANQRVRVAGEN